MVLLEAHQVIPRNAIVSIIETVRNRVLNFALEIEAANPKAGEAAPGSKPLPDQIVNQIFNNYISGNVGNMVSGSSQFQQTARIDVAKGEKAELRNALKSLGISKADITDLEAAIETEQPLKGSAFGTKVSV
jgi:hypothetical protein